MWLRHWISRLRFIQGFAAVAVISWVAYRLKLNLAAAESLQLLVVLAVALRQGFWSATAVSLFANCCLNYYFVPPLFSFYVSDLQNWVALGVFEISALLVSRLSIRAQQQAQRATTKEREAEQLSAVSRGLLVLSRNNPPGPQILSLLSRTFGIERAVFWDFSNTRFDTLGDDLAELKEATMAAYLQDRDPPNSSDKLWIRVLRLAGRPTGAVGIHGEGFSAISVNALASLFAVALERTQSFEREMHAEAERKSEQLRTAVLDSLAHEYKTPLTTLRTAAAGVLEMGGLQREQRELLFLIDGELDRLGALTTRLLQTSRLDNADVRVRLEKIDPDELVQAVISSLQDSLKGHVVRVKALEKGAIVKADRELAGMAIAQFLDNAAKYSNPASPITVSVDEEPTEVRVGVHNLGPYIAPADREQIFRRFFRTADSSHRAAGTGIGLSISRKVADALQGRLWVTSDEQLGNTFFLALPKYGRPEKQ